MSVWKFQLAIAVLLLSLAVCAQIDSPLYRIEPTNLVVKNTDGSQVQMKTVVVTDSKDLRRGLMHVRYLPPNMSMLFLYSHERNARMWMESTYIPLDMWFVSSDGKIAQIVENTVPLSDKTIFSELPVRATIEVNAGLSAKLGITTGAMVHHHVFGNVD